LWREDQFGGDEKGEAVSYRVLDGGKEAGRISLAFRHYHKSWPERATFETFEEAEEYANKWLGMHGPLYLLINEPVDYSGMGDMIEIREVSECGMPVGHCGLKYGHKGECEIES